MKKDLNIRKMAVCAALAMAFGGAMAQNTGTTGTAATNRDTTANSTTSASSTRTGSDSKVASGDQTMMRDISYSNISEVAAGKLALEKSQSDDVKSFAQKMIDDHTKAQQELQTLADGKGVKLPTEPDAKHKAMAKTLSGLKGDAFDKRYLKEGGLNDHQKTHKLLEKVQAKAKDADLKAYAAKTIAAVDQHLTMAQETAGKHGMGTPKGNMTGAATDNGTMGSRTASGAGTTGNPNSGAGSGAMSGGAGAGATGSSSSATAR